MSDQERERRQKQWSNELGRYGSFVRQKKSSCRVKSVVDRQQRRSTRDGRVLVSKKSPELQAKQAMSATSTRDARTKDAMRL